MEWIGNANYIILCLILHVEIFRQIEKPPGEPRTDRKDGEYNGATAKTI